MKTVPPHPRYGSYWPEDHPRHQFSREHIEKTPEQKADQMRAALEEIRERAAMMESGGAWAAGLASLCLATL